MWTDTRAWIIVAGAIAAIGLAAGCAEGDVERDSGRNPGDVTTGLAPTKLLSEISPSEAALACDQLQTGFRAVITRQLITQAFCTLQGIASEDTTEACVAQRDGCITEASQNASLQVMDSGVQAIDFECGDGSALMACNVTVAQLERCFNDTLDVIDAALGDLSCEDAARLDLDGVQSYLLDANPSPPSCQNVDCGNGSPFGME